MSTGTEEPNEQLEKEQMCEHGNFKKTCPKCRDKSVEGKVMENIGDRILSEDEFTQFREGHGFKQGSRGTYWNQDKSIYLYVKDAKFTASSPEDLQKKLAILRHLTGLGVLYPSTRWGVYAKKDSGEYQMFAVTRALQAIRPLDEPVKGGDIFLNRRALEEITTDEIDEMKKLELLFNTPGSHMTSWYRRVESDFHPAVGPKTSLGRILNFNEASHTDNWARNPEKKVYPIDIEVINLPTTPEDLNAAYQEVHEGFVINAETGMLVSDGHEYANIPRMRELIKRANRIRKSLPPVREDYVRLWRGNRPNEVGQNPSFTNSLEGIALPFLSQYNGVLSYVDVPKSDLDKYETAGGAPGAEFIISQELAKRATAVEEASPEGA